MGADIDSACGQLVQKSQEGEENTITNTITRDIEDVIVGVSRGAQSANANTLRASSGESSRSPPDFSKSKPVLSWLDDISNETLDNWVSVLGTAAVVSASVFLASSTAMLLRRRK